ncbi:glycosyl hydrolases family 18 protein [Colletotrichum musicola]|uniref:chitinase n=1 Tax=Colletotrichum musicola TaxID=2175873 RepID=A0A8H6K5B5_9PEZI|nr:glycosyl hydrolases family 18 protein [Colletotrichum musicola]
MRYSVVFALLLWQKYAVSLPSARHAAVDDVRTTCRNPVLPFDYSAKDRREYELPLCQNGEHGHPSLGAVSVPSLLGGRGVVDDYTCGPDRPCANEACCPKKTLQCNFGEEACGTSGVSPNETSSQSRIIGYYEAWRADSACQGKGIKDIPKNSALKVVIAIGGWTFNDPGPTQKVFSNMVSSARNREIFISNLLRFMRKYAFDGFLQEFDNANKKQPVKYIVSFTAPFSYWYLRHFDLKAVDYVDFINVMTYDLHDVWDGSNPIGKHIYGHTNLTEMNQAFGLFWRNRVPASKIDMGLGFYGRAFQLEDSSCSIPGCGLKGGAAKGGCSDESGILSYREIMAIIDSKVKPVHDEKAGVKYITWNTDQWVSFDDADTFAQKKQLAKRLGLGGYLIWAIDQDDEQLTALQAVISPKRLGDIAPGDSGDWQSPNKHCYITSCGGNCDAGDIKITDQPCEMEGRSKLCCPLSGAPDPKECNWRGNAPFCNGHCHDDEVMMQMNRAGDSEWCWDGNKAYCCKGPLAKENSYYWGGVGAKCNGDDLPLTFSGTVLNEFAEVIRAVVDVVGQIVPLSSLTGEMLQEVLDALTLNTHKNYCCSKEDIPRWRNCEWYGKPGNCFDGHCPDMSYAQLTDSYYGGGESCGLQVSRVRTFFCEAAEGPLFLPVPLENLFEHPPEGDSVDTDFSLEMDKDSDSQQNPNDSAFRFVVLASPDELQVSLDKRNGSHWDVFSGCDGAIGEEGPHTVRMVCTDFSDNSNCHKIGLGHGVPGTILQMPAGCGPGKYAVARDMTPTPETVKVILPRHLEHLSAHSPTVYDLTFDYDFSRVPRDLGDTQMRIDFSNQDNYWNTVVAGASTSKKKVKRSLKSNATSTTSHLLAQALLKVNIETSFGFTMIVTKSSTPLDLSQSHLTFNNKGEVAGVLTVEALAKACIPGIALIGPQLTVEGSIDAKLTLAGKVETRLEFANWEVRQVVPDNGDSNFKPEEIGDGDPDLKRNGDIKGLNKPSFYAGVQALGRVTAAISAAAEFGVRFNKRWEVGPAAAAVVGEANVTIKIGAGISTKDTCPFTWGLDVGARLFAKAKAPSVFNWPGTEVAITPAYNKPIIEGGTCPDLGPLPTKRDLDHLDIDRNSTRSLGHTHNNSRRGLNKRASVWGPVLSLPVGDYFCPPSLDDSVGPGTACSDIGYAWDEDDRDEDTLAKTGQAPETRPSTKRIHLCKIDASFPYPPRPAAEKMGNPAYGFVTTNCTDYTWGSPLDANVAGVTYDAEHVLEAQLVKQFFEEVDFNLELLPDPELSDSRERKLGFCQLVRKMWKINPVAIPNLDNASGVGKALTPAYHIANQFPTDKWKKDEYVRLDSAINSPPKANAWAGLSNPNDPKKGKLIQIISWEKWIGGDPNDPNSGVSGDGPNYKESKITHMDGAEEIMKSMRAIVGSRLYHRDPRVMSLLREQKARIGEVLRRLDTEILPANPPQPNWRPWKPLGLKERWDMFMKGKELMAVTKSNKLLNDILPRMQTMWADQARRDAAAADDNDDGTTALSKRRQRRLIEMIDALTDVLKILPAWRLAS